MNDSQGAGTAPQDLTSEAAIRQWLLAYAWYGTDDEKRRTVNCIMSQPAWKYVQDLADQFAGAQAEPGPEAFAEGIIFALSSLYETHAEPHLPSCPGYRTPEDDDDDNLE